jgi:HAD superfamily hydrolase (TIGR01549 family)
MIQAVIFDIDGTLVDSVDLHAECWLATFYRFGIEPSYADVRKQIGKGGDQLMPVFLSEADLKERRAEIERYRSALFKRDYLPKVRAFPKVRELFTRIKNDGVKIVLASSAKKDEIGSYKRIADIDDLVDAELSADDIERSKPQPDIFEAALDHLKPIGPDSVLVVGDTPYDAESARKAGLKTIGVLCGGFPESDLLLAGCVALYRDPADLLANETIRMSRADQF